jgi:hypothetical protein
VALPLTLLFLATLTAAVVAYGVHPDWARWRHGLELILLTRRFQWPLLSLTIVLCVALIAWMIIRRRRPWWLLGLAPVLALLAHRFAIDPNNTFHIDDRPLFVSADSAAFVADDDWVVGLIDRDDALAYPYAALYRAPLVVQSGQESPMLLMWSPFANRALAMRIDRSIKARDLEIISMPANALLLYNNRLGQFINGMTGRTMDGQKPAGFGATIPTIKTTFKRWRTLHPQTRVMSPAGSTDSHAPTQPLLPFYPMPHNAAGLPIQTTVALIGSYPPVAVLDSDLAQGPANFSDPAMVLIRQPITASALAFDRQADEDLSPLFAPTTNKKFPQAAMIDSDSRSLWTADGRAVDGPLKGKRLKPIAVEDGVYYSVLRAWYPDLPLLAPLPAPP